MRVKAKSQKGKVVAAKNQYPHRMGSGGYKTAKAKWSVDKPSLPSSSTDGSGLSQDGGDRAYDWYMGRTCVHPETGERYFPDETTRLAFERLVHYYLNNL